MTGYKQLLAELTSLGRQMRDMQTAYFASRKQSRRGDRKILAASKQLEAEFDAKLREAEQLTEGGEDA